MDILNTIQKKFDTQIQEYIEEKKLNKSWKDLYPYAKEKIPKVVSILKGESLKIIVEVNADRAYDLETRKSVTRISLNLNGTLQSWYI